MLVGHLLGTIVIVYAQARRAVADERRRVFYHPDTADPKVIDFDNRVLRTTLPSRLWAECVRVRTDPARSGVADVACPVYLQFGQHDPIMPGAYARFEAACWERSPVVVDQLDRIGHSFNLHRNNRRAGKRSTRSWGDERALRCGPATYPRFE